MGSLLKRRWTYSAKGRQRTCSRPHPQLRGLAEGKTQFRNIHNGYFWFGIKIKHNVAALWFSLLFLSLLRISLLQFSSVAQLWPTLCDPMNRSTPGLPVHHQLPEFTQTHVHRVRDAIQPSHPLLSPSPPAPNPSQHQGFFQ